jgi:hypothetical protein
MIVFFLLQYEKEMVYDEYRANNMPRKTLALISGLVLVTVVLFVIALQTNNSKPASNVATQPSVAPEAVATPAPIAHSILALSPNPVTVKPGQTGTAEVTIDTAGDAVSAVQLELAYDPTVISNVKVTQGTIFPQPVVLINKNDPKTGRHTFAIAIQPNQATIQGTGTVAKVTFTAKGAIGAQSQLTLLSKDPADPEKPSTIVTARGIQDSVLKSSSGTTVIVSNEATGATSPAAGSGQTTQPVTNPATPVDQ